MLCPVSSKNPIYAHKRLGRSDSASWNSRFRIAFQLLQVLVRFSNFESLQREAREIDIELFKYWSPELQSLLCEMET